MKRFLAQIKFERLFTHVDMLMCNQMLDVNKRFVPHITFVLYSLSPV